jgi:serine/threonine-protein phosphatase 2B catalytic subunit
MALDVFKKEENIVKVPDPVVFVGDIHGQFYDLVKMLDLVGKIGELNFVFLGDYVDRGMFAFEVVATLYALKLCYPNKITLLRGNHECRQMTENFNFLIEIEEKFDKEIYELTMETFDALPLAALVDNKILAVHGGISPELPNLQAINRIDRFKEIPRVGLFTDLMWSDPVENDAGNLDELFAKNSKRSCSFLFGN